MQIYPVLLLSFIYRLPETPRWFIFHGMENEAKDALTDIYGEKEMQGKYEELVKAHKDESSHKVGYGDMVFPSSTQWHETCVTIMGQVNQALTGYGAVSVYGPQIFELLGLGVSTSEFLTMGNYVSYFFLMTFAWLLIDRVGRRILMVGGAFGIAICFLALTLLGGLAQNSDKLGIPNLPIAIVGGIFLFIATGIFGIGWLSEVWLIPTEIFPSTSRAQGSAISVVIWGLANFAVTLLTPIGFNNLNYWLFLVFAVTNAFAGWWTWVRFSPTIPHRLLEWLLNQLFHRHIPLRRVAAHLNRTSNSSPTPRTKARGGSRWWTKGRTDLCQRTKRGLIKMERLSHCSDVEYDALAMPSTQELRSMSIPLTFKNISVIGSMSFSTGWHSYPEEFDKLTA